MASNERQNLSELITAMTSTDSPGHTSAVQQLLVAAGLLAGLLEVDSLIIDKNGQVDVVLKGYIKGKNNFQNLL